jgi:hypothetical protein
VGYAGFEDNGLSCRIAQAQLYLPTFKKVLTRITCKKCQYWCDIKSQDVFLPNFYPSIALKSHSLEAAYFVKISKPSYFTPNILAVS